MAMMMTGRVLLVCALCVLWCCGAAVVSSIPDVTGRESVPHGYLVVNWEKLLKNECATDKKYINEDGTVNESAVKDCIRDAMRVVCNFFCRKISGEPDDSEGERICAEYVGSRDDAGQSSPVITPAEAKTLQAPRSDLEELGKTPEKTPKSLSGGPATEDKAAKPAGGPTPPVEAQHNREENMPVLHPEDDPGTTESNSDSEEDDSASATDNQESVTPDGHDKSTPTLLLTATDTVKNEAGRVNTEGTQNPATESNAERKEVEESDEKTYDNTKNIPAEAAATTNNTAMPGDSESSSTAPPAGESDAATTTTPNNHDARSLNNNGNNTFTEEVDQMEAAIKPKSAPDSTDSAAANSEASTTAITISTNTTNKTTTGDSDGSITVSHTTSPLLLLLVVACAAAAAVVAA
ncbi:mucin-associated surface protein [Trypanosoma cruzi cruzi]|uniref:Mucin-associated surface protein (MASP) n=1 Tax=Trypanosoma cruzi TaxID=5693 RepID=A0A2V2UXK6_TRYCR|nr:mucin-associated surface protein [Trypanosoma cruzi cruzi]PWU88879.1 Mucin-associated surface protein (MASP) [Trypanosoma cruzi]